EGLAQDLDHAVGARRQGRDLAAQAIPQPEGLLEGVGIGLTERPAGAFLPDAVSGLVGPGVRFPGHDLLDTDSHPHRAGHYTGRPLKLRADDRVLHLDETSRTVA